MAPKKRKVVDLSIASSDEDSSSSFEPPSGPKAGPSKSTTARVDKKKEASPERKHLELAQENGKSELLRPRSVLFGGKGTGNEHAGLLHGPSHGHEDSTVTAPKRRRKSAEEDEAANALLRFGPDAEEAEDALDRLDRLKFGRGKLFVTTKVDIKRGRPKKGAVDTSSDESDADDDSKATLDTILGKDPDTEVQRALVVSSSVQLPWLPNRFATTRISNPRPKKEHLNLSGDEGKDKSDKTIKKKKKAAPPRLYAGKIPLLVVHVNGLGAGLKIDPNVVLHRPVTHEAESAIGASLFLASPLHHALVPTRDRPVQLMRQGMSLLRFDEALWRTRREEEQL